MSARNTVLFGAALAVSTAAIAYDHATHPVPERPSVEAAVSAGTAPCAAGAVAPCAAGAPVKAAPPPPPAAAPSVVKKAPPPPPAARPALKAPPPAPLAKAGDEEAPDLLQDAE